MCLTSGLAVSNTSILRLKKSLYSEVDWGYPLFSCMSEERLGVMILDSSQDILRVWVVHLHWSLLDLIILCLKLSYVVISISCTRFYSFYFLFCNLETGFLLYMEFVLVFHHCYLGCSTVWSYFLKSVGLFTLKQGRIHFLTGQTCFLWFPQATHEVDSSYSCFYQLNTALKCMYHNIIHALENASSQEYFCA